MCFDLHITHARGVADVDNMRYALLHPLARVTKRRIIVELGSYFSFLRNKKYSHSFIKLRLNH